MRHHVHDELQVKRPRQWGAESVMEASRAKCALCPGRQQGQADDQVPHRVVQILHRATVTSTTHGLRV